MTAVDHTSFLRGNEPYKEKITERRICRPENTILIMIKTQKPVSSRLTFSLREWTCLEVKDSFICLY